MILQTELKSSVFAACRFWCLEMILMERSQAAWQQRWWESVGCVGQDWWLESLPQQGDWIHSAQQLGQTRQTWKERYSCRGKIQGGVWCGGGQPRRAWCLLASGAGWSCSSISPRGTICHQAQLARATTGSQTMVFVLESFFYRAAWVHL